MSVHSWFQFYFTFTILLCGIQVPLERVCSVGSLDGSSRQTCLIVSNHCCRRFMMHLFFFLAVVLNIKQIKCSHFPVVTVSSTSWCRWISGDGNKNKTNKNKTRTETKTNERRQSRKYTSGNHLASSLLSTSCTWSSAAPMMLCDRTWRRCVSGVFPNRRGAN